MSSEANSNQSQDNRRKGHKGLRGRPIYHNEVKQRYNFTLTPTAREIMSDLAAKQDMSASDWLESLLRMMGGKTRKNEQNK